MPHNKINQFFFSPFLPVKVPCLLQKAETSTQKRRSNLKKRDSWPWPFREEMGFLRLKAKHFCGSNVFNCFPYLYLSNCKKNGDKVTVIYTGLSVWFMVQRMPLGRLQLLHKTSAQYCSCPKGKQHVFSFIGTTYMYECTYVCYLSVCIYCIS